MAVAFGSISSTTYASRTNTTVTAPTGISNGDLLIAQFFILTAGSDPPAETAPSGWTQIGSEQDVVDGFNAQADITLWYKIASSESGDYTWTHSTANSQGMIARYTGVSSGSPINVSSSNTGTPANTTRTALSVTTTVADCMLVYIGWDWADNANDESPPTGMTERIDNTLQYVADVIQATAQASGDKTNTCNSNSGEPRGAWLVALTPSTAAQNITGALFTNANSLFNSTVASTYAVTGALFTDSDTLFGSTVTATANIAGALFTDSDTIFGSTLTTIARITSSLFSDADIFYDSTVALGSGPQTITGALFTDTDTFFAAGITTVGNILPSLFTNTTVFYDSVLTGGSEVGLLEGNPTYPLTMVLGQRPVRSLTEPYPHGSAAIVQGQIYANRLTNVNQFFSASLSNLQFITGQLFSSANTLFASTVTATSTPHTILPALFTDSDTFFASTTARQNSIVQNTRHENSSVVFGSTVNSNKTVTGALHTNTNTIFAATVSPQLSLNNVVWQVTTGASSYYEGATMTYFFEGRIAGAPYVLGAGETAWFEYVQTGALLQDFVNNQTVDGQNAATAAGAGHTWSLDGGTGNRRITISGGNDLLFPFTRQIAADGVVEGDEVITMTILGVSHGTIGTPSVNWTIKDALVVTGTLHTNTQTFFGASIGGGVLGVGGNRFNNTNTFHAASVQIVGAFEWPDATNTGFRTSLTNSGSVTTSANGQIIQNLRINGGTIIVNHSNVIVRDCEILNNSFCIEYNGGSNLLIEYCTLHPVNPAGGNQGAYGIGMWSGSAGIVSRCNIFGFENGAFFAGDDKQFLYNYIHDVASTGQDPHFDGIQSTGAGGVNNATFTGNNIISRDTSCIIMQDEDGGYTGTVRINNNRFIGDPNISALIYARGDKSAAIWAANLEVTNNVMEGEAYGYRLDNTQGPGSGTPGTGTLTWTGNTRDDGVTPVDP